MDREFGPCSLMEDHREALFFWRKEGLSGRCCVHVDAHLDTSEFWVPQAEDRSEPHINCGNYLLFALREGIVAQLVWVLPPHLCEGRLSLDWAVEELTRWGFPRTDEVATLRTVQGRLEGQLQGRPFTLCFTHNLPKVPDGSLLDIDIDYFLDEKDGLWQTPLELQQFLPAGPKWGAVTVAYSVEGGYTPLRHRHLGNLTAALYQGQFELATRQWEQIHSPQPCPEGPGWLQAAQRLQHLPPESQPYEGPVWAELPALDAGYQIRPQDLVNLFWQRKDFDQARHWLRSLNLEGVEYLRGLVANSEGHYREALEHWQQLLDKLENGAMRTHIHHLMGLAWVRCAQEERAVEAFQRGLKEQPKNVPLWRELGRALAALQQWEPAARALRKATQLAPEQLATQKVRLELAQIYRRQNLPGLAQAECSRVLNSPSPGFLKLKAEAILMQILTRPTHD